MGGKNETMVQPRTSSQSAELRQEVNVVGTASIRFHENDGMVHFHNVVDNDQDKLKVEIPSAVFWSLWRNFKNDPSIGITYVDYKNKARLTIGYDNVASDIVMQVAQDESVQKPQGPTWKALDRFVNATS